MPKATRICKVCGREYEYCKTWLSTDKFRYQDVACSPACGAEYFARIEASRSGKTEGFKTEKTVDINSAEKSVGKAKEKKVEKKQPVKEAAPVSKSDEADD